MDPKTSRWAWISITALCVLFLGLSIQKIWNVDIWWQLATGRWIVDHRAFPLHDVFSFTVPDHPWIELRWIFCVLAYWGWEAGGPAVLIFGQTAIIGAAFGAIIAANRTAALSACGVFVLGLGVVSGVSRYVPRPEIFTDLWLAVFLVVLQRAIQDRRTRWLFILPLVQIAWVNTHTVFVLGPIVAWTFAAVEVAKRMLGRRLGLPGMETRDERAAASAFLRPLIVVAVLVSAACLVNPYGLDGAKFPITLFHEIHKGSVLGSTIEEFKSPLSVPFNALSWDIRVAVVLVLVTGGTFILRGRHIDPARFLTWLAFVYLTAVSVRNVMLLAIVAVWAGLANLGDDTGLRLQASRLWSPPRGLVAAGHMATAIGFALFAWYFVSDRFPARFSALRSSGVGIVDVARPAAAVDFLLAHPEIQPNVYTDLADGSYLAWAGAPRFPVFVDARLEVYGEPFIVQAMSVNDTNFDALAKRWNINAALLRSDQNGLLAYHLTSSPDWALVHLDARNVLFIRDIPAHAAVIAKNRVDPQRPWIPRQAEPDERVTGALAWIGRVPRPWHSLGMAKAFLAVDGIDNAVTYLRRTQENVPDHAEARYLLGMIEAARARPTSTSPSAPR
jgi:hypothetical protein